MDKPVKYKNSGPSFKTVAIITLLGVAGVVLYKFLKNRTQQANLTSANLDDLSVAQAAKFFGLFGVVRAGGVAVATPIIKDSTQQLTMLLAQNIAIWPSVQAAFTDLCGGSYTVLQAAKRALSTSAYTQFVDYINVALTQKMMFTQNYPGLDIYAYLNEVSYNTYKITFEANRYVGRCQGEIGNYYRFISQEDGGTYYIEKKFVVLK